MMTEDAEAKCEVRDELKAYIYHYMPLIDERLRVSETQLSQRDFHAATIIVKELILEVSNDDNKDDFAEKPWFAVIFHHARSWYRETYGEAFDRDHTDKSLGLVLIRDIPVELIVPMTRSRVETPNETAWLSFPIKVEDDENPLDWLKRAPNLALLDEAERQQARHDAALIATALRSMQMNFLGIEPNDDTVSGLLGGVRAEFETAANKILRPGSVDRASALWTIHMAVERTLKAFAQHKTGAFHEIHNLFELFDDVIPHGITANRSLLKKLPRDREVISDRYGLRGTPPIGEVYEAYKAALKIVGDVSPSFHRKLNVGGARFLIRKAPWITLPNPDKK